MPPVIIAPSAGPSGGGGSTDIIAVVTADVAHATNSTVLSDITGLTFNTTASATEVWWVELLLNLSTNTSGAATSDYKLGWTVSGAQTGVWGGNPETGGPNTTAVKAATLAETLAYGSLSSALGQSLIHLRALIHANSAAGAVQIQFAQNASAAGAIATAKVGSSLIARKVRS